MPEARARHVVKLVWRILSYLRPHRARFAVALACMAVHALTLVGVMMLIKFVFDDVFAEGVREGALTKLWLAMGGIVVFSLFRGVFQ